MKSTHNWACHCMFAINLGLKIYLLGHCNDIGVNPITSNFFSRGSGSHPQNIFYQSNISHYINMSTALQPPSLEQTRRRLVPVLPYYTLEAGRVETGVSSPPFCAHETGAHQRGLDQYL